MDSSTFYGIATVCYIAAMMVYIAYLAFRNNGVGIVATSITVIGFVSQTVAFIMRWYEFYQRNLQWGLGTSLLRAVPLTNLYESLIFFVWCLIFGYLIIEFRFNNRSLGAFVTPVAGIVLAFIEMFGISKEITPLVPALQSNWLLVHVLMSFIAYSTFALSFSSALMYMITTTERTPKPMSFWAVSGAFILLLAAAAANPHVVPLWIANFALIVLIDIKLNVDIAKALISKKEGESSSSAKAVMTGMITGLLSLVTIGAIFFVIQLIKLQLGQVDKIRGAREAAQSAVAASFTGEIMGIVGIVIFVLLVFFKYLILKKEFYLFWTITIGTFAVVLGALGLDFLVYGKPEEGQSFLLKSTFLSNTPAISVISFVAAAGALYAIWRYGHVFKRVILSLNISSDTLDYITYKSIATGFPIFTLGGLIFGAIWADQAWGTYWSWDPKETWSLITWFVYAFYLHTKLLVGWRGKRIAVVAVIGFVAVIFTYLGVNLLLSGLHAYGSQ